MLLVSSKWISSQLGCSNSLVSNLGINVSHYHFRNPALHCNQQLCWANAGVLLSEGRSLLWASFLGSCRNTFVFPGSWRQGKKALDELLYPIMSTVEKRSGPGREQFRARGARPGNPPFLLHFR